MPTTAMMIESLIQMRHDPGGVPVDQFWALVERFRADLVNQALAVLGNQNDAEDAAQESLCKAFLELNRLRDPASSRMYGHGIATMVVSEAAAMARNPETRKAAQAQNPRMNYNNPAVKENALLAAAGAMRMFLGGAAPGDPRIQATGDYLVKRLPQWPANNAGNTCFYYMYYGTLTMFQIGGAQWKDWNEALKNALLPSQCKGGDDDGSWDPKADWLCEWGGRVYTTAMGALCLEVYYRYLPAYR